MTPHPDQLAALAAVVDHGTFEAAGRHLHVSTSAVSQRIRALEVAAGQVLVRRATPCTATTAGEALVRLARQTAHLYAEARVTLDQAARAWVDLPVAVNADSLATWFREVLGEVATWDGVALQLHVQDQAFSADLLRRGDVLGAVTSEPVAGRGCTVERLGALRYRPAATPALAARLERSADWSQLPLVVFNHHDALQHDVLAARGIEPSDVVHRVPTSADFHEAVRRGLGWGMLPEAQLVTDLASGDLVTLDPDVHLDVELHWQRWRLDSPALTRLTEVVRRAAAGALGA